MFIRFATSRIDEDSHKPQGVFTVAYSLLESGDLSGDEWKQVREILTWFSKHLPVPPNDFTAGRAIFWFRSTAKESISRIWELVHFLRDHGYHVEIQKCRRLGNVRYWDALQVAAYPSEYDGRITTQ